MRIDVVDNPALRRFEAFADGELAGFIAYSIRNDQTTLIHTEIEKGLRRQRGGSSLVKSARRLPNSEPM